MTRQLVVPFRIRDAKLSDAPALAQLMCELGYETTIAEMRERLKLILTDARFRTLVAEIDNRVCGMIGTLTHVSHEHNDLSGKIIALVVSKKHRRSGVGRALIAEAERDFARRGVTRLSLTTRLTRVEAHRFYKALGYSPNGRRFVKKLSGNNQRGKMGRACNVFLIAVVALGSQNPGAAENPAEPAEVETVTSNPTETEASAFAQTSERDTSSASREATPTASPTAAGSATEEPVVVTASELEESRLQVSPDAGTSTYTMTDQQIKTIAQGENTSFNNVLTRVPSVSDDTYGAIHFRNEDPYYRYYINGTLLPSGINGFSQDIFTRSVSSLTVMVGALSAQYPEGNYGLVDIRTKTGEGLSGGTANFYGGSYTTLQPSFSLGGSSQGTDVYFSGSYFHDALGLENPTSNTMAIHDDTDQYRGVAYLSHQFQNSGRLSLIFSAAYADYEIPNTPGQVPTLDFSQTNLASVHINSSKLNETQNEQTYWGIVAYQQTVDDFSFQLSQVNRWSTVTFEPDIRGDLLF